MTEKTLQLFAKDLKKNISGYIAVTVTDIKTGISFFTNTRRPSFNPALASAYNLEVVKAKQKAIEALNLNETIDSILINLKNQIHIIDLSDDNSYFIYIALDAKKANLAQAKTILNKIKKQLQNTN